MPHNMQSMPILKIQKVRPFSYGHFQNGFKFLGFLGYFRLAKALGASKDFESALDAIQNGLKLVPEDKALLAEEKNLKKLKKNAVEAEKKKYAKMFG